mmetsp:Transcript_25013/g.40190  ORF Transcript_25013/g.40190 Transcript_25013/m.40190 type:complete len:361 (+) Transcript_25013:65-1147(+)|eukprot:CAMPEP_0169163252 /NCGR_PEP_ID=MMETSP1015-20121227/58164_1 /TAXON_ID=342587 /ORGANISM="Karlodinium micrum, Strain CCMP2283" /LENGTH=360 /DNA_ID=CAMNT_0009235533 /DNA_START=19 /DNA_END=1101 /DNA_ORIENTATION=+
MGQQKTGAAVSANVASVPQRPWKFGTTSKNKKTKKGNKAFTFNDHRWPAFDGETKGADCGESLTNPEACQKLDLSAACGVDCPKEAAGTTEPSLLRVAGAEWHSSAEDDILHDDYPYLPARCDNETPLGMSAEQYEQLEASCARCSMDEERHPELSQAVLLRGLPNELCTRPWMQVVLDQAGFKGQVVDCRCQPGLSFGEALVWFTSRSLLDYAVWHFDGCCWIKDALVTASIVKTVPMPPSSAEIASALTEKVLEILLAPPEDWTVDCEGRYVLTESVMCPVFLPVLAPLTQPEEQFAFAAEPFELNSPINASQRLSTIWEEKRSEPTSTEVSTESGASATSVHSEAEESHEGDASSDA